jgi:hypothetical protein
MRACGRPLRIVASVIAVGSGSPDARLREQVVESGERGSMERRGIRVFRDIRHARGC